MKSKNSTASGVQRFFLNLRIMRYKEHSRTASVDFLQYEVCKYNNNFNFSNFIYFLYTLPFLLLTKIKITPMTIFVPEKSYYHLFFLNNFIFCEANKSL